MKSSAIMGVMASDAASSIARRVYRLLVAVFSAYLAFALLVIMYGEAPGDVGALLWEGTWGSAYGAGQVLFKATPILFGGVAAEFALRAGLFNVGVEGQMALGSLATAAVGAALGPSFGVFGMLCAMLAGALAGAAWAALPGLLRVFYGTHEVISTIMLNRLADTVTALLLGAGLAVTGTVHTASIGYGLARLSKFFPALHGSAVSLALLLALLLVIASPGFFRRIRLGREIVLVGQGPNACAAAGIPVRRHLLFAFLISGAIAGLGSTATVLGYKGYYEQGLGAGAGFSGLAVAMLGRADPWLVVFAALLFGTLDQGGLSVNAYVPKELMLVVTAAVIMTVGWVERAPQERAP
jgi:general nucleoside transport system permease protein